MKALDLDGLKSIKNNYKENIRFNKEEKKTDKYHVLVCAGTSCVSSKADMLIEVFNKLIKKDKMEEKIKVFKTGCFGFCEEGPIVEIYPGKIFYCNVEIKDVKKIFKSHLLNNEIVNELLYKENNEYKNSIFDIGFFEKQENIILRNCGVINPEDINEYIANDGYFALEDCLNNKNPDEIIKIIEESGLRGRGGAGFPTGKKWRFAADYKEKPKYVVCNADEGDPGAFMDRSILEGDPHSVLEAMAIAGFSIGSNKGYIYVRAEYPIAIDRIEKAIVQARELGLLGLKILDSGFDFDVEVRLGAGAFVCGEETALLSSVLGKRGEPRPRPPFPAESGLWGKPTLVNNVETYANIPIIIRNGWEWYSKIGNESSKGTKLFALAGKIKNTGLVEVAMGITLNSIIYDIGGGIPNSKEFKAVQTGGPSGGCIPKDYLDTPIDYESLKEVGSIMGSGGMIVMDETDCMVDISRFYLEFSQDESCGKCTPCRVGTKRLLEILTRITKGEGEMEDLDLLKELSEDIINSSLCGLGQSAPFPILSTLKYFKDEYISHIKDKQCPAGHCDMR